MRLRVIQVGRLRDAHVVALRDEYQLRFRAFGSLEFLEQRKDRCVWPADAGCRVALDERGKTYGSPDFARILAGWCQRHGCVTFLVGDADGLPEGPRLQADVLLSLGPMVLPHRLTHLIIVEQLYRAAAILAGHPYHRG